MENERPIVTVDIVLFTMTDKLSVVLVKREAEPYSGAFALPGGYIHINEDESASAAGRRVVLAKAGVNVPFFEQLYSFSGRGRDPRGWSISVAYMALVPIESLADCSATIVPVDEVQALPFDHNEILQFALARLGNKSTYSALPAYLLPKKFTIAELHEMYQKVLGVKLDKAGFRRKIEDQCIIGPTEEKKGGACRPAVLYKLTENAWKNFGKQTI